MTMQLANMLMNVSSLELNVLLDVSSLEFNVSNLKSTVSSLDSLEFKFLNSAWRLPRTRKPEFESCLST